jgi:uncharacterized repeat protein (TIGR01451 family)
VTDVADSEDGTISVRASLTGYETVTVEGLSIIVTQKPVTIQADSAEKVYDGEALTKDSASIVEGELAEGQTFTATVEGSQTYVGSSDNTITEVHILAAAEPEQKKAVRKAASDDSVDLTNNYAITLSTGTLTVTAGTPEEPVDPDKVVTKTHEEKEYRLGETVTFEVNATNIYDTAKTITLTEIEGVTLAQSVFEDVAPGETVTTTATYVIAEADILAGSFTNTITADFEGDLTVENTDEVEPESKNAHLSMVKETTSEPANGETYAYGETIEYRITVTNDGNLTLTDLRVEDALTGKTGEDAWTVESLAPEETATFTTSYVVTEADINAGSVVNVATATATSPDPDAPEVTADPGTTEDPTEARRTGITVEKTVTSEPTSADGKYTVGDTVTYQIVVKNTGNISTEITSMQDLITRPDENGSVEPSGLAAAKEQLIGTVLAPQGDEGDTVTVTYSHVVTEEDLGGSFTNHAVIGAAPTTPDPTLETPETDLTGDDEAEVITDDPENCQIVITKTNVQALNEESIVIGEATFHVALFADAEMTQRVSEVTDLVFGENNFSAQATVSGLKRGTYYVAEVDADGKAMLGDLYDFEGGIYAPEYTDGHEVTISDNGSTVSYSFNNSFLVPPEGYYIGKDLTVTKNVLSKNGADLATNEKFYAGLFEDADFTIPAESVSEQIVELDMAGSHTATASVEISVPNDGTAVTLYITEVTADGTPVSQSADFGYTMTISATSFTVAKDSADPAVTITNQSTEEEEIQTETEETVETEKTKEVKTGDDTPIQFFAFLMVLSAAELLYLEERRRRRKNA